MQPIHFLALVLAIALIYSLFRIGVKAIIKDRSYQFAEGKAAGRIEGRTERVSEHNALQMSDLQTLLEISNTLHVAHKTWRAIPHTEKYRAQATKHLKDLNTIAERIRDEGQANIEYRQLSDTDIIEWLNARADLHGDLETSTIQFPHLANLNGYEHIRDSLKEAYLQDNGGQP